MRFIHWSSWSLKKMTLFNKQTNTWCAIWHVCNCFEIPLRKEKTNDHQLANWVGSIAHWRSKAGGIGDALGDGLGINLIEEQMCFNLIPRWRTQFHDWNMRHRYIHWARVDQIHRNEMTSADQNEYDPQLEHWTSKRGSSTGEASQALSMCQNQSALHLAKSNSIPDEIRAHCWVITNSLGMVLTHHDTSVTIESSAQKAACL